MTRLQSAIYICVFLVRVEWVFHSFPECKTKGPTIGCRPPGCECVRARLGTPSVWRGLHDPNRIFLLRAILDAHLRLLAARLERGELVVARAMACDLTGHRASDLVPALVERMPAARVTHFHVGLAVPGRHVPLLVRVRDVRGFGRAFAL